MGWLAIHHVLHRHARHCSRAPCNAWRLDDDDDDDSAFHLVHAYCILLHPLASFWYILIHSDARGCITCCRTTWRFRAAAQCLAVLPQLEGENPRRRKPRPWHGTINLQCKLPITSLRSSEVKKSRSLGLIYTTSRRKKWQGRSCWLKHCSRYKVVSAHKSVSIGNLLLNVSQCLCQNFCVPPSQTDDDPVQSSDVFCRLGFLSSKTFTLDQFCIAKSSWLRVGSSWFIHWESLRVGAFICHFMSALVLAVGWLYWMYVSKVEHDVLVQNQAPIHFEDSSLPSNKCPQSKRICRNALNPSESGFPATRRK